MFVCMNQHPVGQGGLFSATLRSTRKKEFRFVYDCGGTKKPLEREINNIAAKDDPIDMLFLSHLHNDHVNGIENLLKRYNVKTVVLPYMDNDMKRAVLYYCAGRGRSTTALRANRIIQNPREYFHEQNIIFVEPRGEEPDSRPGDDDAGDDNDIAPVFDDIDTEDIGDLGGAPEGDDRLRPVWACRNGSAGGWGIRSIDLSSPNDPVTPDRMIVFCESGVLENWTLIPYVHPLPRSLVNAFINKVENVFGPFDNNKLRDIIKCKKDRKRLSDCYRVLKTSGSTKFNDNMVSMTLYSGPLKGPGKYFMTHKARCYRTNTGGWMLTGDTNLKDDKRRLAFLIRYLKYLCKVGVFMIPHHGSKNNYDQSLLWPFSRLLVAYVAVGNWRENYKHPHPDVKSSITQLAKCRYVGSDTMEFAEVKLNKNSKLLMSGFSR